MWKLSVGVPLSNQYFYVNTSSWKVRQYVVNEGIYAPAGGETTSRFMSGWLKTGSASAITLLLTSAKNCSQPTKIAQRIKLLTKFAHNEQIYCEQKFAQ